MTIKYYCKLSDKDGTNMLFILMVAKTKDGIGTGAGFITKTGIHYESITLLPTTTVQGL